MAKQTEQKIPKKRGRKPYALTEILEHLEEIERMARDGATETQIAKCFGITQQTFRKYKNENILIFTAIKKGRTDLVQDLRGTLVKKAKGFQYEERKVIKENGVVVREEIYTRSSLPDVAALNLLLKNYDAENWANDPQVLKLREKELELREKQVDANIW